MDHSGRTIYEWFECYVFLVLTKVKAKLRFSTPNARITENRAGLIESATSFHDAKVVGSYWVSKLFRLTALTAKSEDYTTVPSS